MCPCKDNLLLPPNLRVPQGAKWQSATCCLWMMVLLSLEATERCTSSSPSPKTPLQSLGHSCMSVLPAPMESSLSQKLKHCISRHGHRLSPWTNLSLKQCTLAKNGCFHAHCTNELRCLGSRLAPTLSNERDVEMQIQQATAQAHQLKNRDIGSLVHSCSVRCQCTLQRPQPAQENLRATARSDLRASGNCQIAIWHLAGCLWQSGSCIWHLPDTCVPNTPQQSGICQTVWHLPDANWQLPDDIWQMPETDLAIWQLPDQVFLHSLKSALTADIAAASVASWLSLKAEEDINFRVIFEVQLLYC